MPKEFGGESKLIALPHDNFSSCANLLIFEETQIAHGELLSQLPLN
jgi:hypothetical protein